MNTASWLERAGFPGIPHFVLAISLLAVVVATFIVTLATAPERVAEWSLGAGALVVATVTLYYVFPRPARIVAMQQAESELTDIIFFLHPYEGNLIPRDFLIQVHVAFANVGNEKGVISRVELREFQDAAGQAVTLPSVPLPLGGAQYVVHKGWQQGVPYFSNQEIQGPYVIDHNAVMTLRFRARRGLTWGQATTIEQLQQFAGSLERNITQAKVRYYYRSGERLVQNEATIPLSVTQQPEYRQAILDVSNNLTAVPQFPHQQVLE